MKRWTGVSFVFVVILIGITGTLWADSTSTSSSSSSSRSSSRSSSTSYSGSFSGSMAAVENDNIVLNDRGGSYLVSLPLVQSEHLRVGPSDADDKFNVNKLGVGQRGLGWYRRYYRDQANEDLKHTGVWFSEFNLGGLLSPASPFIVKSKPSGLPKSNVISLMVDPDPNDLIGYRQLRPVRVGAKKTKIDAEEVLIKALLECMDIGADTAILLWSQNQGFNTVMTGRTAGVSGSIGLQNNGDSMSVGGVGLSKATIKREWESGIILIPCISEARFKQLKRDEDAASSTEETVGQVSNSGGDVVTAFTLAVENSNGSTSQVPVEKLKSGDYKLPRGEIFPQSWTIEEVSWAIQGPYQDYYLGR